MPDHDIYVRDYSMDPENIDVGVIAEEFGHAAFGLPDIYTLDADGSPANWAIMEAGSWNGILGGAQPAPFPLYFRYIVGWAKPSQVAYDKTGATVAKVGQLSLRPDGTKQGIKIDLPDTTVDSANPLDSGKAWWGDVLDLSEFTLTRSVDLTGTTAPIFSFASAWSIEEGWDYGYVEVSENDGATWTSLQDMDAGSRECEPQRPEPGLGPDERGYRRLRVDLAAYAGKQIQLRLRYSTDMATIWDGWWADDFKIMDGATRCSATTWRTATTAGPPTAGASCR